MGIYVEIPIRSSMEELWEKTQNPKLHERWDLRFTEIDYLPREPELPQRFLYRTRIGCGLKIDGQGESVGTRDAGGVRTSSLKFWADDPKSLIRVGSGYWKYIPNGDAICFVTRYDYETRFGVVGKALDACLFRPLLGWATAWSFDRLRIWIEQGTPPEASRDQALVYAVARGTLAFIWLYHGLVPKLLLQDPIELDLLRRLGTSTSQLVTATTIAGWAEILLALLLVLLWRHAWPLWLTLAFMVMGIVMVAICAPSYLGAAFNPVTLNIAVTALSIICLIVRRNAATAAKCLRQPKQS